MSEPTGPTWDPGSPRYVPQAGAWVRGIIWVAVLLACLWTLSHIYHTLLVFGMALFFTYALAPLVRLLTRVSIPGMRRPPSWAVSVTIVYLCVTLLIGSIVGITVPRLAWQLKSLAESVPGQMPRLQAAVEGWEKKLQDLKIPQDMKTQLEERINRAVYSLGEFVVANAQNMASGVVNVFTWMLFVFTAYILAIFMLLNLPDLSRNFYNSVPELYRNDVQMLLDEMHHIFGGFVKGTGFLALLVGLIDYVLLSLLALFHHPFEYALVVAIMAAVAYLIPIVGILAVCLVAGILAWLQVPDPGFVTTIVVLLLIVTNAVDRIVGPKVMSESMGVSPLFVMFAAFAGAELMGFWGAILGVPAAAMVKTLWQWVRRRFLTVPAPRVEIQVVGSLESTEGRSVLVP